LGGKKRVLLTASAIILLCLTLFIGSALALFSDRTSVRNHLVAGDLEADLWRTNLEYTALNSEGKLQKTVVDEDLNFSNVSLTEDNVFGVKSESIVVVPGSYFDADLELRNVGNVAFTYVIKLVFVGDSTNNDAFAKQLKITIVDTNGNTSTPKTLDKFTASSGTDYIISQGELKVSTTPGVQSADKFSVKVEFIDDDSVNNLAQAATATFDLIVEAVQATG